MEQKMPPFGWIAFALTIVAIGLCTADLIGYGALVSVFALMFGLIGAFGSSTRDSNGARPPTVSGDRAAGWFVVIANGMALTFLGLGALLLNNIKLGPKGRRMRIDGRPRVAPVRFEDTWNADEKPDVSDLSLAERAALAEIWKRTGQLEHASVPAFADLSMRLVALGAPPDLVERSHHAALDEIDHARRCFALVSGYLGVPRSPGPMPVLLERESPLANASPRARLALGSLLDGCLGEGVASEMAAVAAAQATDPFVRRTLEIIARDEATHAALAWDVIEWCFESGDAEVVVSLQSGLERLQESPAPSMPTLPGLRYERLAGHGYVDNIVLSRLQADGVRRIDERLRRLLDGEVRRAA